MKPLNDDIRSPEALADPYGFYRRLREYDPVHWSERSRAWVVTSHAEVSAALRDDERLSSDRLAPIEWRLSPDHRAAMAQTFELLRGWMVFRDTPEHEQLRDPVRRAFTPRTMGRISTQVESIVEELLDAMAERAECDLVSSFAFPLPAIVIAELLGVPPEDRERFKMWSSKLGGIVFGAVESPERNEAAREGAAEFTDYFARLIERYEDEPGDNLISALIAARDTGGSLSARQMVGACTMLLFAGHETTAGLISSGTAALLRSPDQHEKLRADPSLAPSAVEEFLRYDGPARVMVRLVRRDHERGGYTLRAGDRVYVCLGGANHDPAVFREPEHLDIARDPNPHLAFGYGLHFCLGAALARLETRIALTRLLERFPALSLRTDQVARAATIIGGGIPTLSVRLR